MSLKKQLSAAHSGEFNPADMQRKTVWRVINLVDGSVWAFRSRDAAQRYAGNHAAKHGMGYSVDRDGDYVLDSEDEA